MDTRNGNFEQNILIKRTLPVVVPKKNSRIDHSIAPVVVAPQTVLTPEMKEVVVDTVCGSAWVNRNPQRLIRTGVNGSTLANVFNAVRFEHSTSPFLIGIVATFPHCGLSGSL